MSNFTKVICALGVLGIGVFAAIPFYLGDSKRSAAPSLAERENVPWRDNSDVQLRVRAGNDDFGEVDHSATETTLGSRPPAEPPRTAVARIESPKLLEDQPTPSQQPSDVSTTDIPRSAADMETGNSVPKPDFVSHVIVDGDTLPDLAEHYLGDRTRHLEIYRANPQLASPTVLPINLTIVIPIVGRQKD